MSLYTITFENSGSESVKKMGKNILSSFSSLTEFSSENFANSARPSFAVKE